MTSCAGQWMLDMVKCGHCMWSCSPNPREWDHDSWALSGVAGSAWWSLGSWAILGAGVLPDIQTRKSMPMLVTCENDLRQREVSVLDLNRICWLNHHLGPEPVSDWLIECWSIRCGVHSKHPGVLIMTPLWSRAHWSTDHMTPWWPLSQVTMLSPSEPEPELLASVTIIRAGVSIGWSGNKYKYCLVQVRADIPKISPISNQKFLHCRQLVTKKRH